MNPIKAKRLSRLAQNLTKFSHLPKELLASYPLLAEIERDANFTQRELKTLLTAGLNPPHASPNDAVLAAENPSLSKVLEGVVKRLGGNAVLAGGMAVIHWVDIRKTIDLDFAILSGDLDLIRKTFPTGSTLDLIYTTKVNGIDVDFLLPSSSITWTEEAIRTAPIETVLGVQTRVLLPEYLVLYKLLAARDRDHADIEALLTLKGVTRKARKLVERFMPEEMDEFESLATLAEYNLR